MLLLAVQPLTTLDPMPRIPRLHQWYFRVEQGTAASALLSRLTPSTRSVFE